MNASQILSNSRRLTISGSTSSLKSINTLQRPYVTKTKTKESRFKYQSLIEGILGNKIDTVDLTGAEPKPNELMMILSAIKSS
jgi:hypothetical protein